MHYRCVKEITTNIILVALENKPIITDCEHFSPNNTLFRREGPSLKRE